MKRIGLTTLCSLGVVWCATRADAETVTYADQIRPLFQNSCLNCHNPDKHKAGLDLSTYDATMTGSDTGKVVEVGNVSKSLLFSVITHAEEPFMPAKSDKLPDSEIDIIKKWIESGAPERTGSLVKKKIEGTATVAVTDSKPAGPPPMPADLLLEPVVHAKRSGAVAALAGSPWAPLVAVAGQKQVLLFNTDTLELAGILAFPEGFPEVLRFSRDGQLLIAGGGLGAKLGRVVVWDVTTGRRVIEVGDEFDQVLAADISPDHSLIALGGPSKLVKIFSAQDGKVLHKMKKHTNWVTALSFTADGKSLVTGDRAGGLVVWDTLGRELQSISAHKGAITGVACSPGAVATASDDGTIKLWDLNEGKERKSWEAHKTGVRALAFATDGQLVSCGRDKLTRLWDANGNQQKQFEEFADEATQTAFAGGKVIAGDWTGAVRVWTPDGKRVGELDANPPTLAERVATAAKRLREIEPAHVAAASALAVAEAAAAKLSADAHTAAELLKTKESDAAKAQSDLVALEGKLREAWTVSEAAKNELARLGEKSQLLASNSTAAVSAHEAAVRELTERQAGIQEKQTLAESLSQTAARAEATSAKAPTDTALAESARSARAAAEKAGEELAGIQKSKAAKSGDAEQLAAAAKKAAEAVTEHEAALTSARATFTQQSNALKQVQVDLDILRQRSAQLLAENADLKKTVPAKIQQAKAAEEAVPKARAEEKKTADQLAAARSELTKWTAIAAAQKNRISKRD